MQLHAIFLIFILLNMLACTELVIEDLCSCTAYVTISLSIVHIILFILDTSLFLKVHFQSPTSQRHTIIWINLKTLLPIRYNATTKELYAQLEQTPNPPVIRSRNDSSMVKDSSPDVSLMSYTIIYFIKDFTGHTFNYSRAFPLAVQCSQQCSV